MWPPTFNVIYVPGTVRTLFDFARSLADFSDFHFRLVSNACSDDEEAFLAERAAGDAVQIHGANGYSDEYPVGRFYRNCKGAVIYEGSREIHKIMQADYLLGYRTDRPTRCALPAWEDKAR